MSTCAQCDQDFDPEVTHDGVPRRTGPRRLYCSRTCGNRSEHLKNGRDRVLREQYGISKVEYDAMWERQGGRCLICGRLETTFSVDGRHFSLNVDHDHVTGEIRGLLCTGCNRGIGFLQDDAELLDRAAEYLRGDLR